MGRVIKSWERGSRAVSIDSHTEEVARRLLEARAEAEGLRRRFKNDVIHLAINLAREVLAGAWDAETVDLDPMYQRALQSAQCLREATIFVHPKDRAISGVEQMAKACGFSVEVDPQLGRGGCRIRSGRAEVDATVETALETLKQSMKEEIND